MLAAAIDIGSNTTRLLVAEPVGGALQRVAEERVYTHIAVDWARPWEIDAATTAEIASAVAAHVRLAEELGADSVRTVATAAIRGATNAEAVRTEISRAAGAEVEILSEEEEGRLAFIGATETLDRAIEGEVAVVDVGGASAEVIVGKAPANAPSVRSFAIGSGSLADRFLHGDPPSTAEVDALRGHIERFFAGERFSRPDHAIAVGGSATSLHTVVGPVLEPDPLEAALEILTAERIAAVAGRFGIDARRVRLLPAGVLLLEQVSELLDRPLRIGRGGLREGMVLEMAR